LFEWLKFLKQMNMRTYLFSAGIILFVAIALFGFLKKTNKPTPAGFALVELFTSEGCSSCPPADEAVSALARQYKEKVYILGFHVDYWNYLGWKDAFSSGSYSERQKRYASFFQLNSVYTPEIVVNGKTEFVGSDKNKLQQVISQELKNNMAGTFAITATTADEKNVQVKLSATPPDNDLVNIALVQLQAKTQVKRGENTGKELLHINIVRAFKTIDPKAKQTSASFILPDGLGSKAFSVIAFYQDKTSWHIDGVTEIPIR
jgi:hypothetical protein